MIRYAATAGVLGVGWFVVLLVPGMTRGWLLEAPWQNLLCLVLTSVIVAVLCRGYIEDAETPWEHLIRAVVLPYVGCFAFLTLWSALLWGRTLIYGGLANLHDTVSLYAMGMTAAVVSCFVVVPYGFLCQYVMNAVARSRAAA